MSDVEESSVTELLALQADLLNKMIRNIENFANEPNHSKNRIERCQSRLQTYQRDFDEFTKNHRSLVKKAKPNDKKNDYFKEMHIDFFEEKYCDAVAAVKEQIAKLTATKTSGHRELNNQFGECNGIRHTFTND